MANRLEARGHLEFGTDYTSEINGQTVYRNSFRLNPDGNAISFYIHLAVFDAHGIPASIEIIEPVYTYGAEATNALLARAISMIQPQSTGQ